MDSVQSTAHAATIGLVQEIIDYMEAHLLEPLTPGSIAAAFHLSAPSAQALFRMACDLSLMEYIRNRRLTLAGQALLDTDSRVIDLALQYGYETPEAFSRAFARFHGIPPGAVRRLYPRLAVFAPLAVQVSIRGGWQAPAGRTESVRQRQENAAVSGYTDPTYNKGGTAMNTYRIDVEQTGYKKVWDILLGLAEELDGAGIAFKVDGKTMLFAHGIAFEPDKICLTFQWGDEARVLAHFGHREGTRSTFPGFKYFDTRRAGMLVRCMFYDGPGAEEGDAALFRNADEVIASGHTLRVQSVRFYLENVKERDEYYEMAEAWMKAKEA